MPILLVIGQTLVIYLFLLVAMRRTGRLSLAGMTPVGYMSIALLGSAVETALYKGFASLWAGLASAVALMVMNKLITASIDKWPKLRFWLAGGPIVLVHDGRVIRSHLDRVHLTRNDLQAALRKRGYYRLEEIRLAVLEIDGAVCVIPAAQRK